MSLTDDLVIRELTDLAERATPPMALVPASVLSAGRRRRRRTTGARAALVAGLGVAVAGAVIPALDPPDAPDPVATTADLAPGLVASAANAAEVVPSGDGDMLLLTDSSGRHYTARFDGAEEMVVLNPGTVTSEAHESVVGFGMRSDEGDGILQAGWFPGDALVAAGYVLGPGDVRLEWSAQGVTRSFDLPTFAVPGAAGRVYLVRIDGAAPEGGWPLVAVVHDGVVEHRADIDLTPLRDGAAGTVELAPGVVAVRTPVPVTLDDGSSGVDLGIRVSTAPEATWPVALVPLTDAELAEVSGSSEEAPHFDAGVWVTGLAAPPEEGLRTPWLWNNGTDSGAGSETRWDGVIRTALNESGLFLGVVPQRLADPRVVLYSRAGFTLADGSRVATLEAPVYESPTGDGRLLYTVWIPAPHDGVDGFATDVDATFAIGSDGTIVAGQRCAGLSLDECAGILGPDVYDAVRAE